jgi:hypothetical protein
VSSYEGINNFPISGNPSLNFSTLGTDSFQRANANPIGGNWTTSGTFGALQIVSDAVEAATGGTANTAYWNASAFNNDQWSQVTVGTIVNASGVGPGVRLGTSSENGYVFLWQGVTGSSGTWRLQKYVSGTLTQLATGTLTVSVGDVLTIAVVGTNIYLYWNGVFVFTIADSGVSSGSAGMLVFSASGTTQAKITGWSGGNFQSAPSITFSISGNVGTAGATINYSGPSSGSVVADGSGNYTISGLSPGTYTITPSKSGFTFSPLSAGEGSGGSNITGVNFTAISGVYSVPDCRISYCGLVPTTNLYPNGSIIVNGTKTYTVETSNNPAIPPTDSRAAGAPVASGTYPQNSRAPGTYGPDE